MTTMNLEIYDALIQAKFPEKPARVVAQAITAGETATKENIKILELKIGWVKSDLNQSVFTNLESGAMCWIIWISNNGC